MRTHDSLAILTLALTAAVGGCKRGESDVVPSAKAVASGGAAAADPKPPSDAPEAHDEDDDDRTPNGYVKMSVGGVAPTSAGEAVLLVDTLSNKAIPIFVGGTEALSIQLRLEKREFVRPLTHDLYDATLKKLGGRIQSVRVDRLQNNTYYGTVVVMTTSNRLELDARPSDAIALALGNRAPIHVARKVVDEAGIEFSDIPHGKQPVQELPLPPTDERPPPISL